MNLEESSLFSKRPALAAILLYILGIHSSLLLKSNHLIPLLFVIITLFALAIAYVKEHQRVGGWLAFVLLVFLGWYLTDLKTGPFPPNHVEHLAEMGGRTQISGRVDEEPDIRDDKAYLVVEADSILINRAWIPTFGRIRASVKNGGNLYQHADYLVMSGFLYRPSGPRNPDGFDYASYLRNKCIYAASSVNDTADVVIFHKSGSFLSEVVAPLRTWLVSKTRERLSSTEAAILSGFILGERRDIPSEYESLFRNTGTMHLMAVSGSNVGVIVALFAFPLALLRVPRKPRTIALLFVVAFFAVLTRLEPSVVRASIMASIGLLAYGWVRKPDYVNLLALAGFVMLLWNPLQLFDVGMQLSFAATFGIIYALPKILKWLSFPQHFASRWIFGLAALLLSTVAAQAAVMPIMAHDFQAIPLVGLLANIPVGFLAMLATMTGVAFYFASMAGSWLSGLIAAPLGIILDIVIRLLRFFSSLPYANIRVASPGWPAILLYWIALYVAYELIVNRRWSRRGVVAGLVALNFVIWGALLTPHPDQSLELIDLGRNHAWIFSARGTPSIGCLDCYVPQDDADNILIPHILNHHGGKLSHLFTTTPLSADVQKLMQETSARLVTPESLASLSGKGSTTASSSYGYGEGINLPEGVKIIWPCSDNIDEGGIMSPALQIDVGDGVMILAAWNGTGIMKERYCDKRLRLLELPWSVYARGSSLATAQALDPEVLVFSPDRYSVAMPRSRGQLTHSQERLFSTSICGGFSVNKSGSDIRIETMRSAIE